MKTSRRVWRQPSAGPRLGFTLVELLVVITIILVLLALLAPAMDKAIYQAELAVCATNLRSIATGATIYAAQARRFYPHRPGVRDDMIWIPAQIYNGSESIQTVYNGGAGNVQQQNSVTKYDDRTLLRTFVRLNSALNDPMVQKLDYETVDLGATAWSTVSLWYGWGYQGQQPMAKLGDRFTWEDETGQRYRFDVLASDRDSFGPNAFQTSHPDAAGTAVSIHKQNQSYAWGNNWVLSFWGANARGPVDLNFAHDDGSVGLIRGVKARAPEMAHVWEWNAKPGISDWRELLPPQK